MVKGQVSLEYLMTYGIAIAIVVIAVAALYSMGVFSPSSSTVACSPCFSSFAFVDYSNGTLVIKNGPKDINITSVTPAGVVVNNTLGDCALNDLCEANKKIVFSNISTTDDVVDITIRYKDILSDLTHTDTATIHN